MAKSKRQLADEAYLRTAHQPVPEGALVGQIDGVSGAIAGAPTSDEPVAGIPPECPVCQRKQTLAMGWTPMVSDGPRIQCGGCGAIVPVTAEALAELRQQLRWRFAASDAPPPKPTRRRKDRGAG